MNTRLVSRIKVESITALGGSFCEIPIVLFAFFLDVLVLVLVTIICIRVPPDGTKKGCLRVVTPRRRLSSLEKRVHVRLIVNIVQSDSISGGIRQTVQDYVEKLAHELPRPTVLSEGLPHHTVYHPGPNPRRAYAQRRDEHAHQIERTKSFLRSAPSPLAIRTRPGGPY